MLKITYRILIVLLISVTIGVGIFHIVNYAIVRPGISFEKWPETFKWLRHVSSLGLIGIFEHALPFVVAIVIVAGIERLVISKK
jgi:hypothetical protein